MKKIHLFIIALALTLTACVTQKEVWEVERYPMEWEEEILLSADHFHIKDMERDSTWRCYEFQADTFCWVHRDTIVVKRLVKTIYTRRNIKLNGKR
jgi:hypothetical protein